MFNGESEAVRDHIITGLYSLSSYVDFFAMCDDEESYGWYFERYLGILIDISNMLLQEKIPMDVFDHVFSFPVEQCACRIGWAHKKAEELGLKIPTAVEEAYRIWRAYRIENDMIVLGQYEDEEEEEEEAELL